MTNITEFLGREQLAALPMLCGMPAGGSDYECFRAFCRSAEVEPFRGSEDVRWVRAVLHACFACELPPDAAHCDAVWQMTAGALLENPDAPALPPTLPPPSACPELPRMTAKTIDCPPLAGADTWAAWCTEASHRLAGCAGVRVTLPENFRTQRTSLWHTERLLHGVEHDPNAALSQQVDFLAGCCSAERRLCLITDCAEGEVLRLLTQTARRRGALPPLAWRPSHPPARQTLLAVVALIRTSVDVPPVIWL